VFEKIGAIPMYVKDKYGADGKRARFSYQIFNNIVFSVYSVLIFLVYEVTCISYFPRLPRNFTLTLFVRRVTNIGSSDSFALKRMLRYIRRVALNINTTYKLTS